MDQPTHNPENFETGVTPTWCPGCGNLALWTALKNVLAKLELAQHDVVVVFDIGCSGNGANFINTYAFHGLHGRSLPLGVGVSLANHRVKTIIISGDGAGYGEGLSHFLHTMRANPNVTYIVEDNQVYGLTKGQTSPTSMQGFYSDSTPSGSLEEPLNPIALALAGDASFVARTFAGDLKHLQETITAAIHHPGFALVDIFQPCVTFNHVNTYAWFYQRVNKLDELGHDPSDKNAAWLRATASGDKFPIGVFFQHARPTYQDGLPQLKDHALADRVLEPIDLSKLLQTFA